MVCPVLTSKKYMGLWIEYVSFHQPLVVQPPFQWKSCWRYRRVKHFLSQVSRINYKERVIADLDSSFKINPNLIQYHFPFLARPHFVSSIRISILASAASHTLSHHNMTSTTQWRRSTRRSLSVESDIGSVCRICKDGVLVSPLPSTKIHVERYTSHRHCLAFYSSRWTKLTTRHGRLPYRPPTYAPTRLWSLFSTSRDRHWTLDSIKRYPSPTCRINSIKW